MHHQLFIFVPIWISFQMELRLGFGWERKPDHNIFFLPMYSIFDTLDTFWVTARSANKVIMLFFLFQSNRSASDYNKKVISEHSAFPQDRPNK